MKKLTLEFFAARFGFGVDELSYGIGNVNGENIPVILVKNQAIFINIKEDCFHPKEIPNLEMKFEECDFSEDSEGYIFETSSAKIILTRDEVERFYAGKYYSQSTEKYIG